MKLSKKAAQRIATLITQMDVSRMMREEAAKESDHTNVAYYLSREYEAGIELADKFGIELPPLALWRERLPYWKAEFAAFAVLKQVRPVGEEALRIAAELRDWVGKEIGPIAKPKDIRFGDNLPKTRSGKIMRRLLRSIAKGEEINQDVSTLENPAILDQLKEVR